MVSWGVHANDCDQVGVLIGSLQIFPTPHERSRGRAALVVRLWSSVQARSLRPLFAAGKGPSRTNSRWGAVYCIVGRGHRPSSWFCFHFVNIRLSATPRPRVREVLPREAHNSFSLIDGYQVYGVPYLSLLLCNSCMTNVTTNQIKPSSTTNSKNSY